jgi:hypothetical protein
MKNKYTYVNILGIYNDLSEYEEDFSKNIIFKVSFICIIVLIIYNILNLIFYYSSVGTGFNFLSILINSSLGIIIGLAIYNSAINFDMKIGEISGFLKIVFDFTKISVYLYYNNYLGELYNTLNIFIIFPGLDEVIKSILFFQIISSIRPFWIEILDFGILGLNLFSISLISYYFHNLGKERNNNQFKMTSIAYIISFILLILFSLIPFAIFYLSSIILETIFLAISFNIFLTIKIKIIEQLNPNYKPIRTEYK